LEIKQEDGSIKYPEQVARFRELFAAAHGILIITPEYNFSIPPVVKNAIDWLSRPPNVLRGKVNIDSRLHVSNTY
jgi:NAD(P)H-dependent FMN reductase